MENKTWDISHKPVKVMESSHRLSALLKNIFVKGLVFTAVFLILLITASSLLVLFVSQKQIVSSAKASVSEIKHQSQKLLLEDFDFKKLDYELGEIDSELLKIQKIITAVGLSGSLYSEYELVGMEIGHPQNLIRITTNLRKLITISGKLGKFQNLSQKDLNIHLQESLNLMRKIIVDFKQIKDSKFLASYSFDKYQNQFEKYERKIFDILELSSFIPEIVGYKGSKRYLILFQNNREARPTGGFIGTFGVIEARDGQFSKPYVQDAYYLNFLKRTVFEENIEEEKSEFPSKLKPCPEIRNYNFHWSSLMDGNWVADFAKSAKKIEWSFDNIYHQGSVDGVIALDPNLVEELLKITGPIKLPDYDVSVSAENFRDIMEYKIEIDNSFKKKTDRTVSPKQILSDFADLFYFKLSQLSYKEYQEVTNQIYNALYQKHILLYFNNPRLQKIAEDLNLAGRIVDTSSDYLHINRTSIVAMKSSRRIKDKILYRVKIEPDSSILGEVKIERYFQGKEKRFSYKANTLIQIYTREDTEIIGSQIGRENNLSNTLKFDTLGKRVFAAEVKLLPGEKEDLSFQYRLPFSLKSDYFGNTTYELLVQKQPGIDYEDFVLELEWPIHWEIEESPGFEITSKNTGIIKKKLYSDTKFSFDFQT